MDIEQILNMVSNRGLAIILCSVGIYIALKVFKIYEKESLLKYERNKKILDSKIVENFVSYCVWYHSKNKLQVIRSILIANNIGCRETEIKLKIKNSLERISLSYMEYFNSLNTSIENLGDWYCDNFNYEHFIKEVMIIVFKPIKIPDLLESKERERYKQLHIAEKIDDISNIMIKYQSVTTRKLHEELKKKDVSTKSHKLFL